LDKEGEARIHWSEAQWDQEVQDHRGEDRGEGGWGAVIECLGERAARVVVFAERNDMEVMGVEALEGLGLEVDPVTRQLRRSESMLALTALDDRP
jgi:hypothetical protein